MERLAALYKSEGQHSQAVVLWESVAANTLVPREETWENLAIHYEHREKNLPRALILTGQVVQKLNSGCGRLSQVKKWTHRQQRLLKKLQGAAQGPAG